ncbi:MAG: S-methyl-5'-thioadenosine phosphorylase [Deltaproteobacteria bacterium]|nr:S-methyl-5'-thioadenosine phosphorylase [Deltaproteobacteria bacterium]
MSKVNSAAIGVIGGSGLYSIDGLSDIQQHAVETPFGAPSELITSALLGDARLLFLPRHGRDHSLLPSEINYRANIFALKSLGAKWCVGVSAVGSLRQEFAPGHVVIPDQVIDKTFRRESTFFGGGLVAHVSFAQPYCPVLRSALEQVCRKLSEKAPHSHHSGGTYVCMEGPAFSTRAESNLHRQWGADLIGMTAMPEAKLAREAEMAYATLALVTDYDCWRGDEEDVSVEMVASLLKSNAQRACKIIAGLAETLPRLTPSPLASQALRSAIFCDLNKVPVRTVEALLPIIGPYLSPPVG